MGAASRPETPEEALAEAKATMLDLLGVESRNEAIGVVVGLALGELLSYKLYRRMGAPRWAAYGLASLGGSSALTSRRLTLIMKRQRLSLVL